MNKTCICPECKNSVDLSKYSGISNGTIIECNHCGMVLSVRDILSDKIITDIVDEGK
jgi:uncharacterized Zn finger protein